MSWPVPAVDAASGSLRAAPPASERPLARAISMTAVRWAMRHAASTGAPSGPVTTDVRFGPPSTSRRPSPPSDIGTSSMSWPSSQPAWPTAAAASAAVAVPRNLSIAATTLIAATVRGAGVRCRLPSGPARRASSESTSERTMWPSDRGPVQVGFEVDDAGRGHGGPQVSSRPR